METVFSTHANLVLTFLCETLPLNGEVNGHIVAFHSRTSKDKAQPKKCQSKEWCHQPADALPTQKPVNEKNSRNVILQSQRAALENHNLQ